MKWVVVTFGTTKCVISENKLSALFQVCSSVRVCSECCGVCKVIDINIASAQ